MHLQFLTVSQRYKLYSDPSKMKILESKKKIWGEVKFLSMEIPTGNWVFMLQGESMNKQERGMFIWDEEESVMM